jgi:hypothetical protein
MIYFCSIPRIRLMFKADDPETFAQRVKFAVDLRREVENNLRFVCYGKSKRSVIMESIIIN